MVRRRKVLNSIYVSMFLATSQEFTQEYDIQDRFWLGVVSFSFLVLIYVRLALNKKKKERGSRRNIIMRLALELFILEFE
jgi:hypothetical protein